MWVGRLWLDQRSITFPLDDEKETCGLLLGCIRQRRTYAQELLPLPNDHDNPTEHFKMKVPAGVLHGQAVGVFHSHPNEAHVHVYPSDHDRAVSIQLGLWGLVVGSDGCARSYLGKYTSPLVRVTTMKDDND